MSIENPSERSQALGEAVRFLRSKDRLEAELLRALSSYPEGIVESVVTELKRRRYLDDALVIADHRDRRLVQGKGRIAIEEELIRRGADPVDVANAMADTEPTELDRAESLARSRQPIEPARLGRWLSTRGFDDDVVEAVLNRIQGGA